MADRLVKVLENGRLITRGLNTLGSNPILFIDEDETLAVSFNWTDWLDGDTISSVANSSHGPGVSGASNTTTTATFRVSATRDGYIEHRITTAAGNVKELNLLVRAQSTGRDYPTGWC
jgi:hypothetical protein